MMELENTWEAKHPRPDFEVAGVPNDWLSAIRTWASGEPGIDAIYLFGSRVTGCYRSDSDIDLAILLSEWQESPERPFWKHNHERIEAEMAKLLPIRTDVRALDWFRGSDFVPDLFQHGIRIYQRG